MNQHTGYFERSNQSSAASIAFASVVLAIPWALAAAEGPIPEQPGTAAPAGQAAPPAAIPQKPAEKRPFVQVKLIGEFGFVAPVQHTIKKGKDGTTFNYVTEGGQDNLFPAGRISTELTLAGAHTIIFLYQPLDLRTQALLDRDIVVDGLVFPKGTPLNLRYGFDFWRISYLYNFLHKRPRDEASLGLSLQIRNAAIEFDSADGQLRRSSHNIGPVPAIKLRLRYEPVPKFWIAGEFDAMYAPLKYINGSSTDVIGSFFDLSVRAGYRVWYPLDMYLNVRYVGGGASGTGSSSGPGDGYTENWINLIFVTIGVEFDVTALAR